MDIKTLQLDIYSMTEDELFYKKYYEAHKDEKTLSAFLGSLNLKELMDRHLLVPEIPKTMPQQFEDTFFFSMDDPKDTIIAQKHNRYSPAFFHKHTFFELIYVYDGTCRQRLSYGHQEMKSGDICIIPPGIEHTLEVFDSSIVLNVLIRRDTIHNMFAHYLNDSNILSTFFLNNIYAQKANDYILFHTGNDYEIRRAFLYMLWESVNKDKYYSVMIADTLNLCFGLLLRLYSDTVEVPVFTKKEDEVRYTLLQYIQQNYKTVTLSDVAHKFSYTPEYTSKLIKETTGMTFTEITQKIRLENAQDLLNNTNLTVTAISEEVGYDAPEHFIRLFKKKYHMTPTAYRRLHNSI